jgi:hypothetical protein
MAIAEPTSKPVAITPPRSVTHQRPCPQRSTSATATSASVFSVR